MREYLRSMPQCIIIIRILDIKRLYMKLSVQRARINSPTRDTAALIVNRSLLNRRYLC